MAKKQITISSFKNGLDSRRDALVLGSNVLLTAQDGVITQGGDFEKRKGYFQTQNVNILDSLGDQGTFGIQNTINGLYVFGSAIVFGGSVTLSQPTLASAMPTGVTYQQLKHPAIYDGETYDRTKHRITAVFSNAFAGTPDVIATFADGKKYLYSNGALVEEITAGVRMAHLSTNAKLAQNLARVVNALGDKFVATYTPSNAYLDVTSDVGFAFSDQITKNTVAGTLTSVTTQEAEPAVDSAEPKAKFRIIAGEDNPPAQSTLTNDGTAPANGSQIIIGSTTYTWKTVISVTNDVLIGNTVNGDAAMTNLASAVNFTGTAGVDYIGSSANTQVRTDAYNSTANTLEFYARVTGTAGNAIGTTTAGTSHAVWDGANLAGGLDTNKITSVKAGGIEILSTAVNWYIDAETTAKNVATQINTFASGYTAESNGDTILITAPEGGTTLNATVLSVTTSGQLCIGDLFAAFVLGGAGFIFGVFNIDGVDVSGGAATKTVGAGLNYTTLESFCQYLADQIYAGVGTFGYTAVSIGNVVYVSKQTTTSSDVPLNVHVTIAPQGGTANGSGVTLGNVPPSGVFEVIISPSYSVTKTGEPTNGTGGWVISTDSVTATPYFGNGSYTFNWIKLEGHNLVNFWLQGLNSTFFWFNAGLIFIKGTYAAKFACEIMDKTTGHKVTSDPINVVINYI